MFIVNANRDTGMEHTLFLQSVSNPGLNHQVDRVFFHHTSPNPTFHILPTLALKHDTFDTPLSQYPGE